MFKFALIIGLAAHVAAEDVAVEASDTNVAAEHGRELFPALAIGAPGATLAFLCAPRTHPLCRLQESAARGAGALRAIAPLRARRAATTPPACSR